MDASILLLRVEAQRPNFDSAKSNGEAVRYLFLRKRNALLDQPAVAPSVVFIRKGARSGMNIPEKVRSVGLSLFRALSDGQHGTRGGTHDFFCDAANKQALWAAASVG